MNIVIDGTLGMEKNTVIIFVHTMMVVCIRFLFNNHFGLKLSLKEKGEILWDKN